MEPPEECVALFKDGVPPLELTIAPPLPLFPPFAPAVADDSTAVAEFEVDIPL